MSYDAILSGMERKRRPILVVVFDANFFEKTFKMAKCEAISAKCFYTAEICQKVFLNPCVSLKLSL